jgi:N-acetylmuramate 1-kinase
MINHDTLTASPDVPAQFDFRAVYSAHEKGTSSPDGALKLIAGDASDRKFFRLESNQISAICMKFPKWEGGYGGDPMSWLGMQSALIGIGIPVPRILFVDEQNACIWTEDFGDHFLNYRLGERTLDMNDPECKATFNLYREALDLLVQVQYPRSQLFSHPAQNRAFDFEKLSFEMNFFVTHFIEGWLGLKFDRNTGVTAEISRELDGLCTMLHGAERVLCHRDYHVRNVMVTSGQLKWIDFQDARMGPHTYDVVSLVRDSYTRIKPSTRLALIQYYGHKLNEARLREGKTLWSEEVLFHEAALMGLQRNIKALGSFGYLATQKQKTGYLKYVQHTLNTILSDEFSKESGMHTADAFPATFALLNDLLHGSQKELLQGKLRAFSVTEVF